MARHLWHECRPGGQTVPGRWDAIGCTHVASSRRELGFSRNANAYISTFSRARGEKIVVTKRNYWVSGSLA